MSRPIQIAIVEDDAGLRDTLRQTFDSSENFRVVGGWSTGEQALAELKTNSAQVVLMDINLPGMSGIECLRRLKAMLPQVRVVMVTVYDDNDTLFQSLVAGADGYLLKRSSRQRLLSAVQEIVEGGAPISPQIARRMVEYFHQLPPAVDRPGPQNQLEQLTAREQEVLSRLAQGFAPKEVAAGLGISWDTVRNHITSIYAKLHVHSRSEAILKFLGRTPASTGRQ